MNSHRPRLRSFPTARLLLCLIVAVILTGVMAPPARADGTVMHMAVVHRAMELVAKEPGGAEIAALLRQHPTILNWAAGFPDIGMAVDLVHKNDPYEGWAEVVTDSHGLQTPELTHEFRDALTNELVPAFAKRGDTKSAEQIVFLLGLISHQEADVPFHWGPGHPAPDDGWAHTSMENEIDNNFADYYRMAIHLNKLTAEQSAAWKVDPNIVDWYWTSPVHAAVDNAVEKTRAGAGYPTAAVTWSRDEMGQASNRQRDLVNAQWAVQQKYPSEWFNDTAYYNRLKSYVQPWEVHLPGGVEDGAKRTVKEWLAAWSYLQAQTQATPVTPPPPLTPVTPIPSLTPVPPGPVNPPTTLPPSGGQAAELALPILALVLLAVLAGIREVVLSRR